MKIKKGKSVIWLFKKMPLLMNMSRERSRRDLFNGMVSDMFIFINNQITPSPCFAFIPNTDVELPKTRVSFYCELRDRIFCTEERIREIGSRKKLSSLSLCLD